MSENFRQAPRLYVEGRKCKGDGTDYYLPGDIMDIIFQEFDGKNGNAIKLMVVLIGTRGDGSFRITEQFIQNRTGMTKSNYHRTRNVLAEKGFIYVGENSITVNLDNIRARYAAHDEYSEGTHDEKKGTHDEYSEGTHDDDYNKEETNKITNNITDNPSPIKDFSYIFDNDYRDEDGSYTEYVYECWECNSDTMSLDEWAEENKDIFMCNGYTYNVDELKAIIDFYEL